MLPANLLLLTLLDLKTLGLEPRGSVSTTWLASFSCNSALATRLQGRLATMGGALQLVVQTEERLDPAEAEILHRKIALIERTGSKSENVEDLRAKLRCEIKSVSPRMWISD